MQILRSVIVVLAAGLFIAAGRPMLAQDQNIVQGQLMRVDVAAKAIVIRSETQSQMQFSYDDNTVVNGVDDAVAGLGTLTGASVSIVYEKQTTRFLALQVDIHKP